MPVELVDWKSYEQDDVFIDRIIGTMLAVHATQAKVRFWLSSCEGAIASVHQTQVD